MWFVAFIFLWPRITQINRNSGLGSVVAKIIDGVAIAEEIKQEVRGEVQELAARGITPGLAVVLVGDHPASQIYTRNKVKTSAALGIRSELIALPEQTSEAELLENVARLNARDDIDGILVQSPLPKQINEGRIYQAIDPDKDVDGFHPVNVGRLCLGIDGLFPCTPLGILEILRRTEVEIQGKRAVVLGRSNIVGKPVAMLLLHNHATVTICHSRTAGLAEVARQGDILVLAMGRAAMVTEEYIKPGAVVLDVGINRVAGIEMARRIFGDDSPRLEEIKKKGYTLVGDAHPLRAAGAAGAITPVPGGVGPLTIAMLMRNTVKAARLRRRL